MQQIATEVSHTAKTTFWPDESASPFHYLRAKITKITDKPELIHYIEDGQNRQGEHGKYIKISRGTNGGYKRFLVIPTGSDPKDPHTPSDYEKTLKEAFNWRIKNQQERKK